MDTASHLLFGVTLAGLSHIDPVVAHDPLLANAVMVGTVIGSHAPDFDTLVRVRGTAAYIRYHRGITHSIPALLIWPTVISLPLVSLFSLPHGWLHLFGWVFLAVVFHVFLDAFNTYGVQCLRPFSKRWMHLDVLSIFEPSLFTLHTIGVILWLMFGFEPEFLFLWIFSLTIAYMFVRSWQHQSLKRKVLRMLGKSGVCHVIPEMHPLRWRFIVETNECFYTGKIEHGTMHPYEVISKAEKNNIIQATMGIDGVRAFLGFAQRVHVTWQERPDGYEVNWSDVRFWYNRKLPFGVDVELDRDLNVVKHKLGWRKRAWDPPFV